MADKHGPIFTIRLGSQRAVVISNWKVAKECFTTNDLAVSSRPRVIAVQKLSYDQAMFAFAPHGPYWREVRKIATLELLSNRRIELLSPVRVSEVETSIKGLFKIWAEKKDELGRVQVEMRQWFSELTLSAVLRMVAGKRCFGATGEEVSRRCLKAMRDFFRLNGLFLVGDAVPCLRWLDLGGHEKAMEETAKELDSILGEWLEEHRQKRASGVVAGDQDFMDVMLSCLDATRIFATLSVSSINT
ncbi:Cytochrome P450 [Sesbania bispinosa]|nr:Cytochrome P450 [Sesbania bispinosa]